MSPCMQVLSFQTRQERSVSPSTDRGSPRQDIIQLLVAGVNRTFVIALMQFVMAVTPENLASVQLC